VDALIQELKNGTAPWRKPWSDKCAPPFNPVSGTCYKGINRLMLLQRNFLEPRWVSFKQAKDMGWRIKKGARAQSIEYWNWGERVVVRDEEGRPFAGEDGRILTKEVPLARPRVKYHQVFNLDEATDGSGAPLPPWISPAPSWDPVEKAEELVQALGASVRHDQRNRAFYDLERDLIHLPPKSSFSSPDDYYSTLLHELAHWTKAPGRLARGGNQPFGSKAYAQEELRAEMASWMLGMDLGLNYSLPRHASYVGHWIEKLEEDHHELFQAASEAEKIKSYILGKLTDFKPRGVERFTPPLKGKALEADLGEGRAEHGLALPGEGLAISQEDKTPRASLVNSFFSYLVRPGLSRDQEERWFGIMCAVNWLKPKGILSGERLQSFLFEASRIAEIAMETLNADLQNKASRNLKEIRAHNDCLALIHRARDLALPEFELSPALDPEKPRYAPLSLKRREKGEESLALFINGTLLTGLSPARGESSRNLVIDLEKKTILASFRSRKNAVDFAAALNSPARLYLGEGPLRESERLRLDRGLSRPLGGNGGPKILSEREILDFYDRLERLRSNQPDASRLSARQERLYLELRLSGDWNREYRPLLLDGVPEELLAAVRLPLFEKLSQPLQREPDFKGARRRSDPPDEAGDPFPAAPFPSSPRAGGIVSGKAKRLQAEEARLAAEERPRSFDPGPKEDFSSPGGAPESLKAELGLEEGVDSEGVAKDGSVRGPKGTEEESPSLKDEESEAPEERRPFALR
jgi:antirestriction protein ArdC